MQHTFMNLMVMVISGLIIFAHVTVLRLANISAQSYQGILEPEPCCFYMKTYVYQARVKSAIRNTFAAGLR